MKIIFFALLHLLVFISALHSQDDSPYLWRYWNVSDGFQEEYCASLTLDHNGHVWVNHGDTKSISFLDGFSVTSIQNPDVLVGNVFNTKDNAQWAFAIDQNYTDIEQLRIGLQRFMAGNTQRFIIPEIQNNSSTFRESNRFLEPEKNWYFHNNIWKHLPIDTIHVLVVLPNTIFLFDAVSETMQQVIDLETVSLGAFHEIIRGDGNTAWVAAELGVIRLEWDDRNQEIHFEYKAIPIPYELDLVYPQHMHLMDSVLYAMTFSTLNGQTVPVVFQDSQWTTIPLHNGYAISDIWSVAQQDFMMLTLEPGRLFYEDLLVSNRENLFKYPLPYKIRSDRNFKPQIETNGNIWINLFSSGIARGALKLWRKDHTVGVENDYIYSIQQIPGKTIAILFQDHLFTKQGQTITRHNLPGSKDSLFDIRAFDNDQILCMTKDSELLLYSIHTQEYTPVELPGNMGVFKLLPHPSNHIMLLLRNRDDLSRYELALYDGQTITSYLDLGTTQDISTISHIYVSRSEDIWICGLLGIRHYSSDHVLQKETSLDFPILTADFCLELKNGNIWMGGGDGIYQFDGKKWETVRDDISVSVMRQSVDDSVWCVSANGVYRFYQGSWVMHSVAEGLTDIMNFKDLMEDHDGNIWLTTHRGIFKYDPNADREPPQTILDETRNSTEVTPDGNTLIEFSGMDQWKYTPNDRLLYSYKLDNGEWSFFQEENSVYLQELYYGSHTIQVRTMDRNWNIDQTPEEFSFTVQYPWYLQTGFIISSIIFFAIFIFRFVNLEYLVRLRTISLKNEMNKREELEGMVREVSEREQRRIGQDLHDGLSQLLAGTRMLVIRMTDKLQEKNAPEVEDGNNIQSLLEQSMGFTRDMIRGLTPISLDKQELDDALYEFALNIQKMFDITCKVEINCALEISNGMVKTNVYRIVQESVNNAIKHGQADLIKIVVDEVKHGYTIKIEDNGTGFKKYSTKSKGMGFQIMEYRASLFKGKVNIYSLPLNGVVVKCEILSSMVDKEKNNEK